MTLSAKRSASALTVLASTCHLIRRRRFIDEISFTSTPIPVVVGKKCEVFHIHEAQLIASSDFFKNALQGDWKAKSERTIKLPDCGVESFRKYAEWLYTGRMCTMSQDDDVESLYESGDVEDDEPSTFADCYALGLVLQDTDFRDNLIDAMVEAMINKNIDNTDLPHCVYSSCSEDSPHRKLAVDLAVYTWDSTNFAQIPSEDYPVEFLSGLLSSVSELLEDGREQLSFAAFFEDTDLCAYHEHTTSKKPCYKVTRGF